MKKEKGLSRQPLSKLTPRVGRPVWLEILSERKVRVLRACGEVGESGCGGLLAFGVQRQWEVQGAKAASSKHL